MKTYKCGHSTEQEGQNRRSNILWSFRGETLTMTQWANKLGIRYEILQSRHVKGWPPEEALTTPVLDYKTAAARGRDSRYGRREPRNV